MQSKIKIWHLLFILFIPSCNYEFPIPESLTSKDLGNITIEKSIVVGDGYLAGAMDGALYSAGQQNSVAAILISHINTLVEIPFIQPEIHSDNGYNFYVSDKNAIWGKWIYRFQNQTDEKPQMILTSGAAVGDYENDKNILNNLAVPMLTVKELSETPNNTNPYLLRVFTANGQNISQQIMGKLPTFVVCWLGMNDYMKYAMNGATDPSSLTPVETFQNNISQLISDLIKKNDVKILLGKLISIENLPYFYFKTFDNLFLNNQELGTVYTRYKQFNLAVSEYNRTVPENLQRPYIDFYDNGSNLHPQPLVVIDNTLSDATYPDGRTLEKFRQLDKNEMVLLNLTDDMKKNGFGWLIPLDKKYYLTSTEIKDIDNRISAFNSVLEELTTKYYDQIALVDVNQKIARVAETGKTDAWGNSLANDVIYFDGVPVGGSLYLNSIFSLDGVHFNQRGNAYVANIFIKALDEKFGAKLKIVNINNYLGNVYEPVN